MTLLATGTKVRVKEKHWLRAGHKGIVRDFNEKKSRYLIEFPEGQDGFTSKHPCITSIDLAGKCLLLRREDMEVMED